MTAAVFARPHRQVLADLFATAWSRSVVLVVGAATLMALLSQVKIPLGFTPVPINLGTFVAAAAGGALGVRRGAAAMGLYIAAGIIGVPVFVGWEGGWDWFTGATGGFIVGYLVLAVIMGAAARRGQDRHVVTCLAAVVVGNAILYTLGAVWLAHVVDVPVFGWGPSGWTHGVRPFLAGDALKMAAAGALLPAAWRFVDR